MLGLIDFDNLNIFISTQPIPMFKSFDGLAVLAQEALGRFPTEGDLFIFYNKLRTRIKLLYWDGAGFVILYKRFEGSKFHFNELLKSTSLPARRLRELLVGATMCEGRLRPWKPFEGRFVV